jgi:hypothetical protein
MKEKLKKLAGDLVDDGIDYVRHNPRNVIKMLAALAAALGGVLSMHGLPTIGGCMTVGGVTVERWLSDSSSAQKKEE